MVSGCTLIQLIQLIHCLARSFKAHHKGPVFQHGAMVNSSSPKSHSTTCVPLTINIETAIVSGCANIRCLVKQTHQPYKSTMQAGTSAWAWAWALQSVRAWAVDSATE